MWRGWEQRMRAVLRGKRERARGVVNREHAGMPPVYLPRPADTAGTIADRSADAGASRP